MSFSCNAQRRPVRLRARGLRKTVSRAMLGAVLAGSTLALAEAGAVGTALAAQPQTLYVSHGGSMTNSGRNCDSAQYSSVQAAVNSAASGATVYLCGTQTYSEEVIVTRSVTLTGDPGASITAPSNPADYSSAGFPSSFTSDGLSVPQAILVATGSGVTANVSGLALNGPLPGVGGCGIDEFGVLVIGGATANLSGDSVTDIADVDPSLDGCQFGVGIQVGREYWPTSSFGNYYVEDFVGHATISNTIVSGYAKNGITVDGPGSTADIGNSMVTGSGETAQVAQNGIQISRGAVADVHNNSISGNQYTGSGEAVATGVIIYGGCGDPLVIGAEVHNNTLTNNDVGIYSGNFDSSCSTYPSQPTNVSIHNNQLSDNVQSNTSGNYTQGYQAGIADVGNSDSIHNNDISGIGYTPAVTSPSAPCYVIPIDVSIAYNAQVHNNNVH
jgi:hypothetical protein